MSCAVSALQPRACAAFTARRSSPAFGRYLRVAMSRLPLVCTPPSHMSPAQIAPHSPAHALAPSEHLSASPHNVAGSQLPVCWRPHRCRRSRRRLR